MLGALLHPVHHFVEHPNLVFFAPDKLAEVIRVGKLVEITAMQRSGHHVGQLQSVVVLRVLKDQVVHDGALGGVEVVAQVPAERLPKYLRAKGVDVDSGVLDLGFVDFQQGADGVVIEVALELDGVMGLDFSFVEHRRPDREVTLNNRLEKGSLFLR